MPKTPQPTEKQSRSRFRRRHSERKKANYPRISIKSIFYVLRIYRRAVGKKSIFFVIYRLYSSIIPSVTAVIVGYAVTSITTSIATQDFLPVIMLAAILLSIEIVSLILNVINSFLSIRTNQEIYIFVSEQITTQFIRIPLAVRESREFADKFNRVRDFGDSIAYVSSNLIEVVAAIISLISIVVATLTVSPIVTLVVILASVPSSIITLKLSASQRINWREYTRDRRISWTIEQKLLNSNNALEVEMNGLSGHLIRHMIKLRRRSQEQDIVDRRKYLWPQFGANALETIASYGVLIFVAIEIILRHLEIGQFFTVRTLLTQLNNNISALFNCISTVNENLVNATDYMEYMQIPPRPTGDIKVETTPKIEFRNVSFSYPNSKVKAIDNVSFCLNPGESIAIVGENGAGKTTLIKLLVGAYEPSDGIIMINDQPFSRIDRESYLSHIGALFQEFARYDFATLGENVWYGDVSRKYSEKDIKSALAKADLAGIEKRYDKGLDQILSKDFDEKSTADLSGGQWQRLSIARAFFRSPNVLLLDEPTAAIDAKSEYEIFQNIVQSQQGKSTIIISHRFSTVRKADSIIVLSQGRIVESGTHDELIAQKGLYKEMFELQAEGYN